MKNNVFDQQTQTSEEMGDTLSHSETVEIFNDMRRYGSLKDSTLAHGISEISYLFPEATSVSKTPDFIKRDTGWVAGVLNGVHKTPFSRIKSIHADITGEEARARGYIKGKLKKEEVFSLLKRTTSPTTIYKKQKFDRDDLIDITDFDAVGWIKTEMRMMLDEEIARAILISDGRLASSEDKIKEDCIRPIFSDDDLYTIKKTITAAYADTPDYAYSVMKEMVKARKEYRGSGSPTLYTTEGMMCNMLLIEDKNGRMIFESKEKLCSFLRVKDIVTIPAMETTRDKSGKALLGILVNLADYYLGADKGGAINMFDDFDIDYNAQKYLIETRCSGALIKPYSAIAFLAPKDEVPVPSESGHEPDLNG